MVCQDSGLWGVHPLFTQIITALVLPMPTLYFPHTIFFPPTNTSPPAMGKEWWGQARLLLAALSSNPAREAAPG